MANFDLMSIFKDKKADVNHSVFDLSKNMAFSLPCSYLTPIYCTPTIPNEKHRINLSGIMRTETLNTAAFVSGKVHVNFFFVPYSQLWHPFNTFVTQKNDLHSTRYQGSKFVPIFGLGRLTNFQVRRSRQYLTKNAVADLYHDSFGYPMFYHYARMLQVCGYGNYYGFENIESATFNNYITEAFVNVGTPDSPTFNKERYVNIFPMLAYQHIYYDYYRNKFYDDTPFNTNDNVKYIDTFNVDDIACNTFGTSVIDTDSTTAAQQRIRDIFELHPIQYKKDFFTSLLPSSQFGPVSSVEINANLGSLTGLTPYGVTGNGSGRWTLRNEDDSAEELSVGSNRLNGISTTGSTEVLHSHAYSGSISVEDDATINIPSAFDVLSARRAELLQRWKQNALRAGNMVDDNFQAHFGVKPFYEDDNNVRFLGSFSCTLNVNPVTATSTTGADINGQVGDLAAIGVGSFEGRQIEFECNDFGLVMAVAAFLPDVYYNANGIKKENTLNEPFDFPNPEFNNVGFEPVNLWNNTLEYTSGGAANHAWDLVLGFSSPWSYLKTNVDEVYDEFSSFHWEDSTIQSNNKIDFEGTLSNWVFKRFNNIIRGNVGAYTMKNQLYVNPNITDSIFGVEFDGSPRTNPFIFSCHLEHKAIRPLSVLGLPEF